jgi:F0F1-type ATP synthase delta subunit
MFEKNKTLTIYAPTLSVGAFFKEQAKKIFVHKKIEIKEDKKLIAGIKIIDNDNVYDFNVRNNLKNLVSYIAEE